MTGILDNWQVGK